MRNHQGRGVNGLDLFSGIGGITLALAPWVEPVAYCESDRYARSVLLSRMADKQLPIAPIWDDIRTLKGSFLPKIDILYGGFPCQNISVAGAGGGLGGEQSGLYFELERLVEETKPTFIFLENVPAIRTRGLGRVVWGLSALGYDCRWTTISAAEVGASFIGKRWFLLAKTNNKAQRQGISPASNSETLRIEPWRRSGESGRKENVNSSDGFTRLAPWSPERGFESIIFRAGNGIPFAVDRDRGLGNSVVPQQAREAFKRLIGNEGKVA